MDATLRLEDFGDHAPVKCRVQLNLRAHTWITVR
jgi:hypothetical protein